MTREEIDRAYPNEWVVVVDGVQDECMFVHEGVVLAHGPTREAVRDRLATFEDEYAMWYVGNPLGEGRTLVGLAVMEWGPVLSGSGTDSCSFPSNSPARPVAARSSSSCSTRARRGRSLT